MSDLFWLSHRQFSRMRPLFPLSHVKDGKIAIETKKEGVWA